MKLIARIYQNLIDLFSCVKFLLKKFPNNVTFNKKIFIVKSIYRISSNIECPHTQQEIISFIQAILLIPNHVKGCIVEAGSFKGGSAVKFSIAAKIAQRRLLLFDSFEGLPENIEPHREDIVGEEISFPSGSYYGTLDEVKRNIAMYGNIEVCEFIKGWFDDTMPKFSEPIAAIYLDVDLASSTRTCLKYLYPLLITGEVLYSQDGYFPLVIDVFNNDKFWEEEVGCPKPYIDGLGKERLIKIIKSR